MVVELHCHTSEFSACSHVNAIELISRAYNLGMQAIVITDHHYQWSQDELDKVKEKAGLPDFFFVLAGQEYKTSDYGDVLLYGAAHTIKEKLLSLGQLREQNPDAAIIWAHPYRHNHIPEKERLLNPLHDGIEIFSSNYSITEAARALKDWHQMKYTAIAGTDTHALSYTGAYPTIFDHPFTNIEEMVQEIKSGRCRPFLKEVPRSGTSDTEVTEVTIGPKSSRERKKIIVKTFSDIEAWKEGERSYHIINEVINEGFSEGRFRISRPLEKDETKLSLIEESVEGENMFQMICNADASEAKKYLKMAAQWLAEFHNLQLRITPADEYLGIEEERLKYYISILYENDHPHTARVQQILDRIWQFEQELIADNKDMLIQGHGDYHLKNLLVGKDKETSEEYVSAIDFNSSFLLPRAFDVGSFIAQYRNMFFAEKEIPFKAPVNIFYQEYLKKSDNYDENFDAVVSLYKARTCLSIIYYLVKVGKGASENFWSVMVDAERSLAHYAVSKYSS